MNTILKILFKEKETKNNDKGAYTCFNLEPKDPRAIKMLNTLYFKVKKAIKYDYKPKEIDIKDEVIQEICLGLCEFTPKFVAKNNVTIEEIGQALQKENDVLAAKYWTYINLAISGAIKDKYKIVNPEKEDKKEIEEVFFLDHVKDALNEDAAADYLNTKNYEYDNGATSFSFNEWFKDNKENILTKAQLKFLAANGEGYSKQLKFKYNKAMVNRVNKALEKEFSTTNLKKIELMKQIEIFDEILQSTNFINILKSNLDKNCIMDLIYNKPFTFKDLKEITALYNNVISKLNFKLFMKLLIALDIQKSKLIEKVNNM